MWSFIEDGLRANPITGGGHYYHDHPDYGALVWLKERFNIKTLLDVGCAYGSHVKLARSMEIDAIGVDGDWTLPYYEYSKWNDYTLSSCSDLDDVYDIGWSIEFVEHIAKEYIDNYMHDFQKCKYLIISSYNEEVSGGVHHVNVNIQEDWIKLFTEYGFEYSEELTREMKANSTMGTFEGLPAGWYIGVEDPSWLQRTGMFFYNTKFKR